VDAFSSDAIPAHLITEEALAALPRARLKPAVCVAFHLTKPLLGARSRRRRDRRRPPRARHDHARDTTLTPQQMFEGKDCRSGRWSVPPVRRFPVENAGGWSKLVSDPSVYPPRAH
jgi:hypothetical protein